MAKSKEYNHFLSILDDILDFLVTKTENYKVNFYAMLEKVFEIKKSESSKLADKSLETNFEKLIEEIFSNIQDKNNLGKTLRLATIHLHNEGFLVIDSEYNVEITFKGLLAYSEGIVNKRDLELSTSQRLKNIEDENLLHQRRMSDATVQMNLTNLSIRNLTRWIAVGAFVAIVYQLIEILKVFFPCYFYIPQ